MPTISISNHYCTRDHIHQGMKDTTRKEKAKGIQFGMEKIKLWASAVSTQKNLYIIKESVKEFTKWLD